MWLRERIVVCTGPSAPRLYLRSRVQVPVGLDMAWRVHGDRSGREQEPVRPKQPLAVTALSGFVMNRIRNGFDTSWAGLFRKGGRASIWHLVPWKAWV